MERTWAPGAVSGMLERAGAAETRPEDLAKGFGLLSEGDDGLPAQRAPGAAILDLQLQRLTGLEQDKIIKEFEEILSKIADLLDILRSPDRLMQVIRDELLAIREQYGDERRTEIVVDQTDLTLWT
jgi:DNA gyrase subunit A